jgi:hypothetical protein
MRGADQRTGELFSYVDLEARVRRDRPLRSIRAIVNEALAALERDFAALYAPIGRPSIPPEKLLRAMLLQAFYSIRSERQLMERWSSISCSAGLPGSGWMMRPGIIRCSPRTATGCSTAILRRSSWAAVLAQPRVKKLLSTDHFSVDGTPIQAWASMKSFKPKDGADEPPTGSGRNAEADFHGKKHSNETHASTSDPDARLYRRGRARRRSCASSAMA